MVCDRYVIISIVNSVLIMGFSIAALCLQIKHIDMIKIFKYNYCDKRKDEDVCNQEKSSFQIFIIIDLRGTVVY